ncbi:hypothetical protein B0H13DRAFT_2236144 [Mycena leptocephala]|nr:hypothetical protein B0H13DRAFT_2236144 [Mycena leptocephala]
MFISLIIVQVALGRDAPNWRLKNACPACLYKVEGEPMLDIPFMSTMDGNNSLSRFELRERDQIDADGTTVPGALKERLDGRMAPGDYYLPRSEVDKWAKDSIDDLMKGFEADVDDEEDGCAERWQNMKEEVTVHAWGMYDETGIFPALCRHGFVLIVVDMVKGGELSKYGFAVTNHLMRVLGEIAVGYDIGCKFGKMVKLHPRLKKLAATTISEPCHNRRCQLVNLTTYVKGVGLEPLEGCDRFHRQQAITTYMKHTDAFDTYQNLSLLLCNRYRRALAIKSTLQVLEGTMRELGVNTQLEFEQWLEKEKAHLRTLSKEWLQKTLEMEYYQKLVNLQDVEYAAQATRRVETQHRHMQELQVNTLAAVHDLELRLGVESRWVEGDERWVAAAAMVRRRRYQRALDNLGGLIIARVFELGNAICRRLLCKHIAKALQARSKAVKTAITSYNAAAEAMTPQMPTLDWEQVVEYAFLSDFDLLREGRDDIREEPWALPAGRAAMDQHFKLLRADEEIQRLNVEIRRFVTYIYDEDEFLGRESQRLQEEGELALAHQVVLLRSERSRFMPLHTSRLAELSKLRGFTGSIALGVSLCRERHVPVTREAVMRAVSPHARVPLPGADEEHDEGNDDGDDDEDGNLATAFTNIVCISSDENVAAADL